MDIDRLMRRTLYLALGTADALNGALRGAVKYLVERGIDTADRLREGSHSADLDLSASKPSDLPESDSKSSDSFVSVRITDTK